MRSTTWQLMFLLWAAFLCGCGSQQGLPGAKTTPLVISRFTGSGEVETKVNLWTAVVTNYAVEVGARLRTGTNSKMELTSTASFDRVLLDGETEAVIGQWTETTPPAAPHQEVQLEVQRGTVLIDLISTMAGASKFEVKTSNQVTSVRSSGTVAAFGAGGLVLVQTGTIVCVMVTPGAANASAITLNAGQMLDPVTKSAKPIPASSNTIWNLLK